jgi:hypothetical protein
MKLAPGTLSIIRIGTNHASMRRGRTNPNILLRLNSVHPLRIRRPPAELAARWRVSPETGRLECRWLLVEQPADDHLWSCPHRTSRSWYRPSRRSPRQRPHRLCHKPVNEPMIIAA